MSEQSLSSMRQISAAGAQPAVVPMSLETEYIQSRYEEVHLRAYWKILVKRRRIVFAVFAACLVVGAYVNFTATPVFQATAMLKIEPQNPAVIGVEMLRLTEGSALYDYYQTQFKLLESRSLAAKVISELNLESDDTFTRIPSISSSVISRFRSMVFGSLRFFSSYIASSRSTSSKNAAQDAKATPRRESRNLADTELNVKPHWIGRYNSFLRVNPIKNTRLVEISFQTPDADLSQLLANAHANGFIRLNLASRSEITNEAREFLDAKNNELKKKVEGAEQSLNRFRQKHGVVSLERGENVVVDRLVELNKQLTNARAQRIEAESLRKTIENKSPQQLSQVMTQALVLTLRANLVNLEAERMKLSAVFKPEHPRLIEIGQQINEARRALDAETANAVRTIEQSYVAARTKEQDLQAETLRQQQMALNLKEVGVEYAVLEEEVKVNRSLYESVLKRLTETNVSNDLAVSNIQIAQTAERPVSPISPDIPFNLLLTACFALLFGSALVFVLEYLDSRLDTPQHVWRAVGLNTFGVVPSLNSLDNGLFSRNQPASPLGQRLQRLIPARFQRAHSGSKDLILSHHPFSVMTESYRTILTALLFSQAEKPPQVVLLTSPSPGEGKTVTTLNLAIALAQEGYRILVIDADLRKGCCHERLGIKNHYGLSNILSGNLSLEDGIRATPLSGLSLLCRGILAPNPSNLLGSARMRQILNDLRPSFDFILIDSPPAMPVTDAAVISVICDGVLLVLHGQRTTMASARQAMERLDTVRAPVLGVILNGIDVRSPDYAYYQRYYGSDYGSAGKPENGGAARIVEAAAYEALPADEPRLEELGPGTVPKEFFDRMTYRLNEGVGPIASLIIREHIVTLGESRETFPKQRLQELLKGVCNEILNETLKNDFMKAMTEEIRSL